MLETAQRQRRAHPRATSSSTARAEVERFLDAVLSIEEHIDPVDLPRDREPAPRTTSRSRPRARSTAYDDLLRARPATSAPPARPPPRAGASRPSPQRDLLLFLLEHAADLEDWQRDVLAIVRQELLYFVPQMQTKIMNEGWASLLALPASCASWTCPTDEYIEFARLHSSVPRPPGAASTRTTSA